MLLRREEGGGGGGGTDWIVVGVVSVNGDSGAGDCGNDDRPGGDGLHRLEATQANSLI